MVNRDVCATKATSQQVKADQGASISMNAWDNRAAKEPSARTHLEDTDVNALPVCLAIQMLAVQEK
jgi:hypothetical protein